MKYSQVKYGSSGSDVKTLQELLNGNGYSLDVDGVYGSKTQAAVKDYQQKNKLAVDGIVGENTWGSLTGNIAVKTPSEMPEKQTGATTTAATTPTYENKAYQPSDAVSQAEALLNQQMQQKPGAYQSTWQGQLNDTINKILNREQFSYDLNSDALYQQYKDQYMQQGQLAMMDTMGQAAAMTGGYGNSYAQSVGQQTYQGYLQQLNDVVPELYQMALNQYNQQGQDLINQYALLGEQENQDYGRYRDQVSDYYTQLQQMYDQYNAERDYDYSKYTDDRNFGYEQYLNDQNMQYQKERDQVEDERWQKEYDFALRQYSDSQSSSGSTGTSSDGNDSDPGTYTGGGYDAETAEIQQKLVDAGYNIAVDGIWGSQTQKAYDDYNSKNGGTPDNPGTVDNTVDTANVSDSIKNKAASFAANEDLANYLDGLTASGKITEEQADALYAEYKQVDKAALNKRSWTLVDDGGVNWFWGVDNNATVKDQYGNTYRLDKLVNALVAEGMSKAEAKAYVKKLQAQLGA